jgi:hypothetical protein
MRTWALAQLGHVAAGVNPFREEELVGLRAERAKSEHPLGDRSLIVLARGLADEHGPEAKALEEVHRRELEGLAAMSRRGKLVVATHSAHHIQLDEPGLVIDSIREVVVSTRRRSP